jgi:hypothetical protein
VFEVNTTNEVDWDELRRVGAEFEHENIVMLGSKVVSRACYPFFSSIASPLPGHTVHVREAARCAAGGHAAWCGRNAKFIVFYYVSSMIFVTV